MKKITLKSIMGINSLLSILISFLGFTLACKPEPMSYAPPPANYAMFTIKGKVQSNRDTLPISNIKVLMYRDTAESQFHDSTYSDSKGNFVISYSSYPVTQRFTLKFKDIDDTLNGKYNELDTLVSFTNPVFSNSNGNYLGESSKVFNVKLKPKK